MKRILLSLVALVVTSLCFAQDIIVQKDGSTILAKVVKVTQSEIEYKKYSNQNGPTYTISTKDLQCINYENGTKDTFVSPGYNPNIVTNETATQFSNDQHLLKMYQKEKTSNSKASTLKNIGWVAGGAISAFGVFLCVAGPSVGITDWDDLYFVGPLTVGVGVATWAGFYFWGKHIEKKVSEYSVQSYPIYQQEFKVGKCDRLMVGVDMLKDNTRKNHALGLGVSYHF